MQSLELLSLRPQELRVRLNQIGIQNLPRNLQLPLVLVDEAIRSQVSPIHIQNLLQHKPWKWLRWKKGYFVLKDPDTSPKEEEEEEEEEEVHTTHAMATAQKRKRNEESVYVRNEEEPERKKQKTIENPFASSSSFSLISLNREEVRLHVTDSQIHAEANTVQLRAMSSNKRSFPHIQSVHLTLDPSVAPDQISLGLLFPAAHTFVLEGSGSVDLRSNQTMETLHVQELACALLDLSQVARLSQLHLSHIPPHHTQLRYMPAFSSNKSVELEEIRYEQLKELSLHSERSDLPLELALGVPLQTRHFPNVHTVRIRGGSSSEIHLKSMVKFTLEHHPRATLLRSPNVQTLTWIDCPEGAWNGRAETEPILPACIELFITGALPLVRKMGIPQTQGLVLDEQNAPNLQHVQLHRCIGHVSCVHPSLKTFVFSSVPSTAQENPSLSLLTLQVHPMLETLYVHTLHTNRVQLLPLPLPLSPSLSESSSSSSFPNHQSMEQKSFRLRELVVVCNAMQCLESWKSWLHAFQTPNVLSLCILQMQDHRLAPPYDYGEVNESCMQLSSLLEEWSHRRHRKEDTSNAMQNEEREEKNSERYRDRERERGRDRNSERDTSSFHKDEKYDERTEIKKVLFPTTTSTATTLASTSRPESLPTVRISSQTIPSQALPQAYDLVVESNPETIATLVWAHSLEGCRSLSVRAHQAPPQEPIQELGILCLSGRFPHLTRLECGERTAAVQLLPDTQLPLLRNVTWTFLPQFETLQFQSGLYLSNVQGLAQFLEDVPNLSQVRVLGPASLDELCLKWNAFLSSKPVFVSWMDWMQTFSIS